MSLSRCRCRRCCCCCFAKSQAQMSLSVLVWHPHRMRRECKHTHQIGRRMHTRRALFIFLLNTLLHFFAVRNLPVSLTLQNQPFVSARREQSCNLICAPWIRGTISSRRRRRRVSLQNSIAKGGRRNSAGFCSGGSWALFNSHIRLLA